PISRRMSFAAIVNDVTWSSLGAIWTVQGTVEQSSSSRHFPMQDVPSRRCDWLLCDQRHLNPPSRDCAGSTAPMLPSCTCCPRDALHIVGSQSIVARHMPVGWNGAFESTDLSRDGPPQPP